MKPVFSVPIGAIRFDPNKKGHIGAFTPNKMGHTPFLHDTDGRRNANPHLFSHRNFTPNKVGHTRHPPLQTQRLPPLEKRLLPPINRDISDHFYAMTGRLGRILPPIKWDISSDPYGIRPPFTSNKKGHTCAFSHRNQSSCAEQNACLPPINRDISDRFYANTGRLEWILPPIKRDIHKMPLASTLFLPPIKWDILVPKACLSCPESAVFARENRRIPAILHPVSWSRPFKHNSPPSPSPLSLISEPVSPFFHTPPTPRDIPKSPPFPILQYLGTYT